METNTCKICAEEKLVSEFTPNLNMLNGVTNVCKKCRNEELRIKRLKLARPYTLAGTGKVCSGCGTDKMFSEYPHNSSSKDSCAAKCKDCASKIRSAKALLKEGDSTRCKKHWPQEKQDAYWKAYAARYAAKYKAVRVMRDKLQEKSYESKYLDW
jgi:coenzyme F420-reducing hydrogenase gamma subunit